MIEPTPSELLDLIAELLPDPNEPHSPVTLRRKGGARVLCVACETDWPCAVARARHLTA